MDIKAALLLDCYGEGCKKFPLLGVEYRAGPLYNDIGIAVEAKATAFDGFIVVTHKGSSAMRRAIGADNVDACAGIGPVADDVAEIYDTIDCSGP